jgi:hypothetical protein
MYKRVEIIFMGARTEEGDNDYSLAQRLLAVHRAGHKHVRAGDISLK